MILRRLIISVVARSVGGEVCTKTETCIIIGKTHLIWLVTYCTCCYVICTTLTFVFQHRHPLFVERNIKVQRWRLMVSITMRGFQLGSSDNDPLQEWWQWTTYCKLDTSENTTATSALVCQWLLPPLWHGHIDPAHWLTGNMEANDRELLSVMAFHGS